VDRDARRPAADPAGEMGLRGLPRRLAPRDGDKGAALAMTEKQPKEGILRGVPACAGPSWPSVIFRS